MLEILCKRVYIIANSTRKEGLTVLTAKQNMQEVMRGGNPERFVNQYEAVQLLFHPYMLHAGRIKGML